MLSMKNEIEKIWDDVLVKLEQEHDVSSAAINAWIKPLHIKDVQSNKIILSLDAKYDERGIQFIKKKISLMQRSTMQDAISAPKVGGIVSGCKIR